MFAIEVKDEEYRVEYNPETATVLFEGALSLSDIEAYSPIVQLLNQLLDKNLSLLTLDLSRLEFLNSSGINVLSRFVIRARQQEQTCLVVRGNTQTTWQTRSLRNLQRLMPTLTLEWLESSPAS